MAPSRSSAGLLERILPVLLLVTVVLAFVVGALWQKVTNLQGGGVATTGVGTSVGAGSAGGDAPPSSGKLDDDQVGKIAEVTSADHIRGSLDADVFLVEYSDLECPFCSQFHSTAKQVVDEYGGDVAWVYRHFPLDTLHPRARPAAEAAECVAKLAGEDAFWAFTDEIFTDQSKLTDLAAVATSVGVALGDFNSCADNGDEAGNVEDQYQSGVTAGVTGTPGNFIVNNKGDAWVIPGAVPFASLQVTIDEALAS